MEIVRPTLIPNRWAPSEIPIPWVPLCDITPTSEPAPCSCWALNLTPSSRLYTPMQFGPTSGIPSSRQAETIFSCSSIASGSPVSAKPEVNIEIPPTFFSMACPTIIGVTWRGTAQITRSTSPGTSATELKLGICFSSIPGISFGSTWTE